MLRKNRDRTFLCWKFQGNTGRYNSDEERIEGDLEGWFRLPVPYPDWFPSKNIHFRKLKFCHSQSRDDQSSAVPLRVKYWSQ